MNKEFTYTQEDLLRKYEEFTASASCECRLLTELVGGVPAGRDDLAAFVRHHLKITGEAEIEKTVQRILKEEIGEQDITPTEGEVAEREVYAVNIIRRSKQGVWLGDWMVKACLKTAASRLNIFVSSKGSKGNFSEAGRVRALGKSLKELDHPERIYLFQENGQPVETHFQKFMGRVHTPQGPKSIVHDSECCPAGIRFSWEFRFLPGNLSSDEMSKVMSLAMRVGVGSSRALERGTFAIEKCVIQGLPEKKLEKKVEKEQGKKQVGGT